MEKARIGQSSADTFLYSTLGDDPDLGEIVEMFVEEMPARLSTLASCAERQEWQELGRLAHQLKGACGSYGFGQLAPYVARLEALCRDDRLCEQEILESIETLVDLCGRVRAGSPR